jgi:hypothetical protein
MKFSMMAAQPSDNNLRLQKQLGIDNAVHARPACVCRKLRLGNTGDEGHRE